ncbi:MAG TPA: hypothetical protein DEB15_16885 [Pusillimonas sp.]|jgi:hypothetical protein|nr:hypothetical protein [Pusillimonas sp.]|tara:strand:- start:69315 stop:69749 length:435 start_codon:yes stop_codon:yes gene_type:complete
MQNSTEWQIGTPLWVWFAATLVLLLAASILLSHSLALFSGTTLVAFMFCRRRVMHSLFVRGSLRFEEGGWIYTAHREGERRVSLERVWPNGVWTTLRFTQEASGANRIMELTVWKSRVSEPAWRALGMQVAQHIAMVGGVRERA